MEKWIKDLLSNLDLLTHPSNQKHGHSRIQSKLLKFDLDEVQNLPHLDNLHMDGDSVVFEHTERLPERDPIKNSRVELLRSFSFSLFHEILLQELIHRSAGNLLHADVWHRKLSLVEPKK